MSFDWYPLWNSLRIAAISCVLVFFLGIFFAYYASRLPRVVKGVLDVILTLPMVLPPTVSGYFLLLVFGVKRPLGIFLLKFGIKFVMTWYGGVLAAAVVAFPLMYRLGSGGFVIDTPGLRGFGLVDLEKEEISKYFPEMLREMDDCRFVPCTHTHEPDCAVKAAVDAGRISAERHNSYLGMLEEDQKFR